MAIERNHAAERIARVQTRLAATKRKMSETAPTDRISMRELFSGLDEMLEELNGKVKALPNRAPLTRGE